MTAEPPPRRPPAPVPLAFEDLYRADWRPVVALGWSLTGDRSVAEELAQEAFLAAYRRWDAVGRMDQPGAWVRRAVANRSVDHHRRARVASVGADRLASAERVRQQHGGGDSASVDGLGDDVFWAAVRALPERQAQCVALHYLEDRAVDDIAAVLDCRPATVRVHLHRGRQALARSLGLSTGSSGTETSEPSTSETSEEDA
jgi:RNA polymerase sigma-70 factor (ECF subfamily)